MTKRNSIGFEGLVSLIHEISVGVTVKECLAIPEVKDAFKEMVYKAWAAASFMEDIKDQNDRLHIDNKAVTDGAMDVLLATYAVDKDAFGDLCLYSGLSKTQTGALGKCFKKGGVNDVDATRILIESHALGELLIQSPKIRDLVSFDRFNNNENDFDAFVSYVVDQGFPHVQLEKIARLTIYQKQCLTDDLENVAWLRESFERYQSEGRLARKELEKCAEHIKNGCLAGMRKTPISMTTLNEIPCARLSDIIGIDDGFLSKKSPAGRPDAWGVKDGKAEIYCVTMAENFLTQDSRSFEQAYALHNGIKAGALEGVTSYEVHGWCDSIVSEGKHKRFNEILSELVSGGIVSKEESDAFKASPVHVEALKMLRFDCPEKFNELAGNHWLGLHSAPEFHFQLRQDGVQYEMSLKSLQKAARVLAKIADKNPSLTSIETAFSNAFTTLALGFECAINCEKGSSKRYNAAILDCKKGLVVALKALSLADSSAKTAFSDVRSSDEILAMQYGIYSKNHADQQAGLEAYARNHKEKSANAYQAPLA